MKKKIKTIPETEYVYAAARIHVHDMTLLNRDSFVRMANCQDIDSLIRLISEAGYEVKGKDIFSSLEEKLYEDYKLCFEIVPDKKVFEFLKYPYDCNNIKSAIKCTFTPGFDYSSLHYKLGTLSEEEIMNCVKNSDFSLLPANMANACKDALKNYAETLDPQKIDLPIDSSCYIDMLNCASASGEKVMVEYVKDLIDSVNLVNAVRTAEMVRDNSFFEEIYIEGGDLSKETLDQIIGDVGTIAAQLKNTKFEQLFFSGFGSFSSAEKKLEDYRMEKISEYRHSVFGPSSILGYLVAREYETKNIRIISAGVMANKPAEEILEKVRIAYV